MNRDNFKTYYNSYRDTIDHFCSHDPDLTDEAWFGKHGSLDKAGEEMKEKMKKENEEKKRKEEEEERKNKEEEKKYVEIVIAKSKDKKAEVNINPEPETDLGGTGSSILTMTSK